MLIEMLRRCLLILNISRTSKQSWIQIKGMIEDWVRNNQCSIISIQIQIWFRNKVTSTSAAKATSWSLEKIRPSQELLTKSMPNRQPSWIRGTKRGKWKKIHWKVPQYSLVIVCQGLAQRPIPRQLFRRMPQIWKTGKTQMQTKSHTCWTSKSMGSWRCCLPRAAL